MIAVRKTNGEIELPRNVVVFEVRRVLDRASVKKDGFTVHNSALIAADVLYSGERTVLSTESGLVGIRYYKLGHHGS